MYGGLGPFLTGGLTLVCFRHFIIFLLYYLSPNSNLWISISVVRCSAFDVGNPGDYLAKYATGT